MSDIKKYYYLKLKDNYFDQDNVKILESMENGYIYSLIVLKLYLKSLRSNGQLMMTDRIPYDPHKLKILAKVLNHDTDHVEKAIKIAQELGIMEIMETGEMFMLEMQNFIGHSSTEADRKREYRNQLGQMSGQSPLELKIEFKDKDKDKEIKDKAENQPDN